MKADCHNRYLKLGPEFQMLKKKPKLFFKLIQYSCFIINNQLGIHLNI